MPSRCAVWRHVAVALLVDAHDVLPAGATEAQRHVGDRRQHGRSVQQRVDQLVLTDWLRNVVVGTGAQRHDHRGKAVDIGDDDDPHRGIELAQLLDQLELITTAETQVDYSVGELLPATAA